MRSLVTFDQACNARREGYARATSARRASTARASRVREVKVGLARDALHLRGDARSPAHDAVLAHAATIGMILGGG